MQLADADQRGNSLGARKADACGPVLKICAIDWIYFKIDVVKFVYDLFVPCKVLGWL